MKENCKKRVRLAAALSICLIGLCACQNGDPINSATAIPTATPAAAPVQTDALPAVQSTPEQEAAARPLSSEAATAVNSQADFAALGLTMPAPSQAGTARFGILDGEIAQIVFDAEGVEYTLRGARARTDIAGVEETFVEPAQSMNVEFDGKAIDVRIRSTLSGGMLAEWTCDGATFTLWAAQGATQDTIGSLALECAMSAGVQ